jgi:hypothetical protein
MDVYGTDVAERVPDDTRGIPSASDEEDGCHPFAIIASDCTSRSIDLLREGARTLPGSNERMTGGGQAPLMRAATGGRAVRDVSCSVREV